MKHSKGINNIYFIGASFRNKGAEAMAITAFRRLRQMYPGCQLTMTSYAKRDPLPYGRHQVPPFSADEQPIEYGLIKDTKGVPDLGTFPPHIKAWKFLLDIGQKFLNPLRIILCGLLPIQSLRSWIVRGDRSLQHFLQADLVVDISGFGMSDQRPLVRRLYYCLEIFTSRCFGVPFVIFTQAMGPFHKFSTRLGAKLFLPRVDLLIARDQSTSTYLKEIGIDRKIPINLCTDSAFLFEPTLAEKEEGKKLLGNVFDQGRPVFGIVPNSVIFERLEPQNEQSPYIQMLVHLSNYVQSTLGATVVFVCHTHYEYRRDDEWLMREVIRQAEHADDIIAIGANYPAGVIKAVIGHLDFIVASRFHSLVAAISNATPFFALGWSHKYDELANDAGIAESVLGFKDLSKNQLIEAVDKAWNQRGETRKRLEAEHDRLCNTAEKAFRLVAEKWPGKDI